MDGYDEPVNCINQPGDQDEIYQEVIPGTSEIKNEISDIITIKPEPEDYSLFMSTEYLELEQDEVDGGIEDDDQFKEEFAYVRSMKQDSRSRRLKGPKAYKRAQCGLCGNFYYKDQLQRHIDVSKTGQR